MISHEAFATNLAAVRARLATACAACGRDPATVTLLPVTKTHPVDAARFAARAGFTAVGENRIQEAAEKRPLAPADLRWELIGHLQSNKTKQAVSLFDRIQTVDSKDLAARIAKYAHDSGKTQRILLQANAGADPAKFGTDFDGLAMLLDSALAHRALRVEGLMTIAPLDDSPDVARRCFDNLRTWRDTLAASRGLALPELSMGMSSDLESAVAAGSTLIRVGTALFGTR